jgi:hypothetical protein
MAKIKGLIVTDIVDGICEIRLRSWKVFLDFAYQEMLDFESYIWRGQRCDNWILQSTLDRLIEKAKVTETKIYNFRSSHLDQFKYAVRGRRGSNPPLIEGENDWWALGQHHGLATPLLDWTTSPFVAAYFAFINTGENKTKYRVVYALSKPSVEIKAREMYVEEMERREKEKADIMNGKKKVGFARKVLLQRPFRKEIEFVKPLSDENQRLVNQGGLFTRSPNGIDLESWIKNNYKGEGNEYVLIKILIPNRDRKECLKTLNRMNINHLTLFPDLYGASKYCNLFGEIEKY